MFATADNQAATSPPLYLGTSLLATRNAVLSMALTAPTTPGISAEGQLRCPQAATEASSSNSDRMRRLLRAGGISGNGIGAFQPNWSILRLKERMENVTRIQQAEREARNSGQYTGGGSTGGIGGIGDGGQGQSSNAGPTEEATQAQAQVPVPKKKKPKKRAADDEPSTTTAAPTAKKKKGKVNETPEKAAMMKDEGAEEVKPKKKPKKKVVKPTDA